MELYIGGRAQGKLAYVMRKKGLEDKDIADEGLTHAADSGDCRCVNHFHLYIKERMRQGKNPEQELLQILEVNPDIILIADEVGAGIVPIEKEERDYRETVGRVLCIAAKRAEWVERIICGLGQRLK